MSNCNNGNNSNNGNNGNKRRRGCMRMACGRWENYPYYTGPCADVNGRYNCGCDCDSGDDQDRENECGGEQSRDCERNRCRRRRRGHRGDDSNAIFLAYLPMAVAANGLIPLVAGNSCRDSCYDVNSGLVTIEEAGTYLATYNVRVPEGASLDTTITLNVDDASQPSAITQVFTNGTGTAGYSAQAIFEADEGDTVSLRTSDAISMADPSLQPVFTMSLLQLEV